MKSVKSLLILVPLLLLAFAIHSFAHDTDLYVGGGSAIEPNVLIMFDNSGSMGDSPTWTSFCEYVYNYSYPQPTGQPSITPGTVYRKKSGVWIPLTVFKSSISGVGCSSARSALTYSGIYSGYTNAAGSPSGAAECVNSSYTLATGNYLRWLYADAVNTAPCRAKIEIAKDVVKSFVSTISGVRIGLMTFNNNTEGGHIVRDIKGLDESYSGKTQRQWLLDDITAFYPDSWTPLAETLHEAGLYFSGAASYFNSGTTYTSPIQYYCQKNYVIVMTDGMSTQDRNTILDTAVGDRNSDQREPPGAPNDPLPGGEGSDFLDDVAKKHYDNDMHSMQGKQNIVTYTIGFELDMSGGDDATKAKDLLQRTATQSHGKFYTTSGAGGLADAFSDILNEVLSKTSSFVAPIVPVSKMERTTAGDKIYLAFFKPNQSGMWSGNIKKYGVAQSKDPSKDIAVGDITDVSGSKALGSNGEFYPSSKSYWTTSSSDGGEVEMGGVGEVLQNRTSARNIYTLLPGDASDEDDGPDTNTSFDLTNGWNAFTTGNSRLTKSILGLSLLAPDADRTNLINFVRGIDVYDDNVNGQTTDNRDWMLGSFLHSRPYIIHYSDRTVIYAGSNDGMLHAFNDSDGQELWAFIPPCLLGRLKELHTDNPGIFVDGSPRAYVTYDSNGTTVTKAILIFGLRRGGDYYYALDVTNPLVPKYLWRIYKGKNGYFNELGQTWSAPVIGQVAYGTGTKWVVIFAGGYDDGQDDSSPPSDTIGRGIYMADVLTGAYIWGKSHTGGFTTMTYSIPSDVAKVDLNGDGKIDRLYVGDMNSRIFRFDIGDLNSNGNSDPDEWTAKKIFEPDTAEKRKIFYPPDVTFEKDSIGEYEMLFFGTGNREDPKAYRGIRNRIYGLKDRNYSGTLSKTDLVDVTSFYSLSAAQQTATLNEIKSDYGWYIELESQKKDDLYGEKCLATPVVYNKTAYFTTFAPSTGAITDPCFVGEGTAAVYAVNYATGEAVFNFDLTNDSGGNVVKAKSDRSLVIGTAIPSGVVITVIGGKVTAYVGVGGGVYRPTLSGSKSLFPVHWKLVF